MKLVSWDGHNINDGTNYEAILDASNYGLPSVDPNSVKRQGAWPLVAGVERPGKIVLFEIYIRGASLSTLQKQLAQWFDPDDEDPKQLIADDAGTGANDRFVMGVCQSLEEVPFSAGRRYVVAIHVHGDVLWRETSLTSASAWNITATGQTKVLSNSGEANAYPIFTIEPTGTKSGSWPYSRFVAVKWRVPAAYNDYPIDIVNNSLDTQIASTNFALSNGDDLRVWVNGVEVDRWLDGPNTSTTKVWVNLDFKAELDCQLYAAIGSGDTSLTVNEPISSLPSSGILMIDSEVITYTSKNNSQQTFYGLTRGAKGTTAASHTLMTQVYWLQHDIWILYGNSSAGTAPASTNTQPIINLASSSNTLWDYDNFGEDDGFRTGAWYHQGTGDQTTGNQGSSADPWSEAGIHTWIGEDSRMILYNPCEIDSANFTNGEKYAGLEGWGEEFWIQSSPNGSTWTNEYQIPAVTLDATWQSWSRNETMASGADYIAIRLIGATATIDDYLEVSDVAVTLDSANTPQTSFTAEQSAYALDCQLYNSTTGQRLNVIMTMDPNEELEIDTDSRTVTYLLDGSNQFQAIDLDGGPRRDWLYLAPGNNTIYFYETGVTGMTINFDWYERYYH